MPKRVDANTQEIVAAWRKMGAYWIDCTGDPSIGFDGILAHRGKLWLVEIKDGSKPPSDPRIWAFF